MTAETEAGPRSGVWDRVVGIGDPLGGVGVGRLGDTWGGTTGAAP